MSEEIRKLEINIDGPALSVIVPIFNECEAVTDTLSRILAVPLDLEILAVDDCSTDGTLEILENFAKDKPRIRIFRHPYNMGNGASVKTGIRNAKAPAILILDADGQHPPEDIPNLYEKIKTYDLVVGERSRGTDATAFRNFGNWVFNTFASYVAGCRIPDLTCGMRCMRTEVAREFIDLFPNGFSLPTTSTLSVIKAGYSLAWVPIKSPARKGKSKIRPFVDGSKFLMIIVRIAVFFKPMRVFGPISLLAFFLGLLDFSIYLFVQHKLAISPFAGLMFQSFLLIFMLGLMSEQIANLRFSGRR
ncbi:MAG: glycosyltransferase family 2 protein [bacterium]|nr:glycosyltransferase family 2 protein [bacterium]